MWKLSSHLEQNRATNHDYMSSSSKFLHAPKKESSDTNNRLFISNSHNTDLDDKIGEWLANEEASLNEIPMNSYEKKQDIAMFDRSSVNIHKVLKNLLFF